MLILTQAIKDEIIESYVVVYGEEYRETITKRINECKVVVVNNNKHRFAEKYLSSQINHVIFNFCHDKGFGLVRAQYIPIFKDIKEIAKNSTKGDLDQAEELYYKELFLFDKVLKLPDNYVWFTKEEAIQYISENFENIANAIEEFEKMWNSSEEKKIVDEKSAQKENHHKKANETQRRIMEIDYIIDKVVSKHLTEICEDKVGINEDMKDLFLRLATAENEAMTEEKFNTMFQYLCKMLYIQENENTKQLMFSSAVLSKIKKLQDEKYEMLLDSSSFVENFQSLSGVRMSNGNQDILSGILDFLMDSGEATGYAHAYVDEADGEVKHVIVLPIETDRATVVHEYGHEIQTQCIEKIGNTVIYRTGFMVKKINLGGKNYNTPEEVVQNFKVKSGKHNFVEEPQYTDEENKRLQRYLDLEDFTPLNEVINEYLTYEVIKKSGDSFDKSDSPYADAFPIIEPFIKTFRSEIINCLMGGDIFEFFDYVGMENIKALNQNIKMIFNSFYLQDSKKYLEKLAKKNNVNVEDLINIPGIIIKEYDKRYIQLLKETKHIVEKMYKHANSIQEKQVQDREI